MGRSASLIPTDTTTLIGGIAPVFRSGDAYKAVGELVSRAAYPALSAAFPRNGSFYAQAVGSPGQVQSIASGNGVFVAACGDIGGNATIGTASFSYDGQRWYGASLPANGTWVSIAFGLGLFVMIDRTGLVCTSPDAINWTQRANLPALSTGTYWNSITFGGGKFVAVAGSNTATAVAASSTDGIAFTARTMPSAANWNCVAFGGGIFLAVTNGTGAATSTDGVNWTARTLPYATTADNSGDCVAYGNGMFIVSCGSGYVLRSTDGVTWLSVKLPYGSQAFPLAVFGNGVFIVTVGTVAYTSSDGVAWRARILPTGSQPTSGSANAYMNGIFVAFAYTQTAVVMYVENTTDSDMMYISGTAGQFVRVK